MWVSDFGRVFWKHLFLLLLFGSPLGVAAYAGMLFIYHQAEPNQARWALEQKVLGADDKDSLQGAIRELDEQLQSIAAEIGYATSLRRKQLEREEEMLWQARSLAVKKLEKLDAREELRQATEDD